MKPFLPALLTHLALIVLWMIVADSYAVAVAAGGYLFTLPIVRLVPFLRFARTYVRRNVALLMFSLYFLWQFLRANCRVAWVVLTWPRHRVESAVVEVNIEDMKVWESVLLSHCVTLTPGTISIGISDDRRILYVHCLEQHDARKSKFDIEHRLKKRLLEFAR